MKYHSIGDEEFQQGISSLLRETGLFTRRQKVLATA
jgi:hypothetical protein